MNQLSNSIKPGDAFCLGQHLLVCGNSCDKEIVGHFLNGRKIKSVITDPPYGVAVAESKEGFKTLAKNKPIVNDQIQSDAEYKEFTSRWINAVKPYLARKNSFYIFNADKMIFALREGLRDTDIKFGQLLIWVKTQAVIGRMDYAPQHELIVYGWHGVHEFLKPKDKSVIVYPKPNKSPYHPTTKPIGLIRRLILNSTNIGDIVYDGFLGSGTCLLSCEQTKRVCIGIEIDPEYCQTIINRFQKLTGITAQKYEGK